MKKIKFVLSIALISSLLTACGNLNGAASNSFNNQNGGFNGAGTAGCISLNQPLGFSGTGVVNDISVLAGVMPANSNRPGNYGQIAMTGAYANFGFQQQGMISLSKTGSQGTLQLQVSAPQYATGYYMNPSSGAPAQITGMVQLNQQVLSMLQASSGYMSMPFSNYSYGSISPYNQQYAGYGYQSYGMANCITSIGFQAISVIQQSQGYPGSGYIQQVLMYLYMNNGSAPTPIIL